MVLQPQQQQHYLSVLFDKMQPPATTTTAKNKPPADYTLSITNFNTTLYQYNFTTPELKTFAKIIKLKITGIKKDVLRKRLYFYYLLQSNATLLQRIFRGYLLRKLIHIQDNIANMRKKCINTTDVVTLEDIEEIPTALFFCYCNDKGDVYGFNVVSLNELLKTKEKDGKPPLNPYTRTPFRGSIKQEVADFIRLSRVTGRATIKEELDAVVAGNQYTSLKQQMEMKALGVFQTINELGNYSDVKWFLDLTRGETLRFINEFYDIWNHRAGLTPQMKKDLCPHDGVLFRRPHTRFTHEPDVYKIKFQILAIFDRLLYNPVIVLDNKKLNAMYILAALTLVSPNAAEAMPAYYFSVA